MRWEGVALALSAAAAHSCIDVLRKHIASSIAPNDIVALVALLDAVISCSCVYFLFGSERLQWHNPLPLFVAVVGGSVLLLLSKFLYQRALHISPLSMTVPYLSFTPAMLLVTAYFVVGEVPTWNGVLGVCIVTAGGYLLSTSTKTTTTSPVKAKPEKPDDGVLGVVILSVPPAPATPNKGAAADDKKHGTCKTGWANQWLGPFCSLVRGKEPGAVMMILVAFLWSLTATLDKIGTLSAPSLPVYFALQRLCIGVMALVYLLGWSRSAFRHLITKFPILLVTSLMELASVVLFLKAIQYILVSYVVAIKRINILISTGLGCLVFKESIMSRLPYILVMVAGMLLIVLERERQATDHHVH